MKNPGPISLKAISDAETNIGVHEEDGENQGKYIKVYLASCGIHDPQPWCFAFWQYRFKAAAMALKTKVPNNWVISAYTPDGANWAKKNGMWISVQQAKDNSSLVKRGDLMFMYKPKLGRIGHVGGVSSVTRNGVYTIEGNTNDSGDREGDGVYRKFRTWDNIGKYGGFCRIEF